MVLDDNFFSFGEFKGNAFVDNIRKPTQQKGFRYGAANSGIIYKSIAHKASAKRSNQIIKNIDFNE